VILFLSYSSTTRAEKSGILKEFYSAFYNGNEDSCLNLLQSSLKVDSYNKGEVIRIMQYSVLSYKMDALEYEEFLYQLYPGTEDFENTNLLLWYCTQMYRYGDFNTINELVTPKYESIKSIRERHPEEFLQLSSYYAIAIMSIEKNYEKANLILDQASSFQIKNELSNIQMTLAYAEINYLNWMNTQSQDAINKAELWAQQIEDQDEKTSIYHKAQYRELNSQLKLARMDTSGAIVEAAKALELYQILKFAKFEIEQIKYLRAELEMNFRQFVNNYFPDTMISGLLKPNSSIAQMKELSRKIEFLLNAYSKTKDSLYLSKAMMVGKSGFNSYKERLSAGRDFGSAGRTLVYYNELLERYLDAIGLSSEYGYKVDYNLVFQLTEIQNDIELNNWMGSGLTAGYIDLPDSLLEQERDLLTEIKEIESLYQRASLEKKSYYQEQLKKKERAYQSLQVFISASFPNYRGIRFKKRLFNLEEVEKLLCNDGQTLLLKFSETQNGVSVLGTNQLKRRFVYLKDRQLLKEKIDIVRNSQNLSVNEFYKEVRFLSDWVLGEILIRFPEINRILVIPEGSTSYLPFEILFYPHVKKPTSYKEMPFLIKKTALRYANSVDYLLKSSALKQFRKSDLKTLAAYAPNYKYFSEENLFENDPELKSFIKSGNHQLPGARNEAAKIAAMYGGKAYLGSGANKETFLSTASDYKIIHLAAHALLGSNGSIPGRLLLSPVHDSMNTAVFTSKEIMQQNLNADLVVLSACNTGSGEYEKGEGVMSLSRAFNYSGVNSIIMSLWKVPDASSAIIIENFYEYMKNGASASEALRLAKLDYLDNNSIPNGNNPHNWAGFILNGRDLEISIPVRKQRIPWHYAILIPLFSIVSLLSLRAFSQRA